VTLSLCKIQQTTKLTAETTASDLGSCASAIYWLGPFSDIMPLMFKESPGSIHIHASDL